MNDLTRRQFLKRASLTASTAVLSFPFVSRVLGADDPISRAWLSKCKGKVSDRDFKLLERAQRTLINNKQSQYWRKKNNE